MAMDIERITDDVETTLQRARNALTQETSTARATLKKLQAEVADASKALADLHDQRKQAQKELDAVLKHLGRASSLAVLDSEITKAKAELKKLQGETASATTALEGLALQRTAAEREVGALKGNVQALVQVRAETEARMRAIREQLSR